MPLSYFIRRPGSAAICAIAIVACCAVVAWGQDFQLNDQMFDQWLFNASLGSPDTESELSLHVEAIDGVCGLTEPQKQRLRLAGRGDYSRFARQVDELKAKYVGKTYGQQEIGEIYQKIQPLGQAYQAGLLGDESLFSKVLAKTLTSEQAAKLEAVDSARRKARYVAKVKLFVVMLERACPLTDKQRTEMTGLLVAETKPPKQFGQYDWYVVMFQANKIPNERYEQFLDDAQMRQLKVTLRQGAGMEQFLRQQQILDD